jgi:carbonic anhydrase/acetyltransferase-like protein (isoleucine patch superfamily)
MALSKYLETFPAVGANVFVHPSAQVIGDVTIGDDCSIWPNAVIRGDVNSIRIGNGTNIQDLVMCHVTHKSAHLPAGHTLTIGNHVTIGHSAILHGCTIGNDVLIGMGSIILDDVVIEDNVMVGAGSLVTSGKRLESGFLYMGSPAKQARPLTPEEITGLRYSAEHYIRVKNNFLITEASESAVPSS